MGERQFQVRFGGAAAPATAVQLVHDFVQGAVRPLWYTATRVVGYRFKAQGSTVSLPQVAPGPLPVGSVAGSLDPVNFPRYVTLSARGKVRGEQTRIFLYGTAIALQADYRAETTDPTVAAVVSAAQVLANSGGFLTDSSDLVVVKPYLNIGISAYYQRRARQVS